MIYLAIITILVIAFVGSTPAPRYPWGDYWKRLKERRRSGS